MYSKNVGFFAKKTEQKHVLIHIFHAKNDALLILEDHQQRIRTWHQAQVDDEKYRTKPMTDRGPR